MSGEIRIVRVLVPGLQGPAGPAGPQASQVIDVTQAPYNCVGNDATDCTVGLQAAFDDLKTTGKPRRLRIPAGIYRTTALSSHCVLWRYPGIIEADRAIIRANAGTPNTVDILRVDPEVTGTGEFFWKVEGLWIDSADGASGQHCFHIDLDDTASEFLAKLAMRDCWFGKTAKRAFSMNKGPEGGTPANMNGLFTSHVQDCRFDGGPLADYVAFLDNSGDSLKWSDVTLTGTGIGLYSRPVSGAVQQVFEDINSTASGGAFYLKNAGQAKIRGGQLEQSFAYTGADDALIVLDGATDCEIAGPNINAYDRVSAVRFKGAAARNRVHDASIRVTASKFHFVIDAASGGYNDTGHLTNRFYTDNNQVLKPLVSDASATTQYGVWRAIPLSNGWNAAGSGGFTDGLYAMSKPDGIVRLKGWLTGGTNTAGTVIATLPAGMRPLGEAKRITVKFLDTTWKTTELNVLVGGTIQIPSQLFTAVSLVGFDSVSFSTY